MNVTVRSARQSDASEMYRISCHAHQGALYMDAISLAKKTRFIVHYTESAERASMFRVAFLKRLASKRWSYLVACNEERKIVAYSAMFVEGGQGELKSLFVAPEYQGRGTGQTLLSNALSCVPSGVPVRLEVLRVNDRAKQLYERNGFRFITEAKRDFYGAPLDVMERS